MAELASPLLRWTNAELQGFLVDPVPHHVALGLRVLACSAGRLSMMIPYAERLADEHGGIEAGVITTLVDASCGSVALTMLADLLRTATLELRADFLRPCPPGRDISCDARCLRVERDVAFVQAEVRIDDSSEPIAVAIGTFAIFGRPSNGGAT